MRLAPWLLIACLSAGPGCGPEEEGVPCGTVTEEGLCEGDRIVFCQNGNLTEFDCADYKCVCTEDNEFGEAMCMDCPQLGTPTTVAGGAQ